MSIYGTWKLDVGRSEDPEKFLLDCGFPKEAVDKMKPKETITVVEDAGNGKVKVTTKTPGFPDVVNVAGFGETTEVTTAVGLKFKVKTVDNGNNKYTDTSVDEQGRESVTVREINGNECKAVTTVGDKKLNFYLVKA